MAKESLDIPNNMRKVHRRFERWRSAHTGRLPIPRRLWAAAVELARGHGIFQTAKALRLEYGKLKRLVDSASPATKGRVAKAMGGGARRARSTAPPEVVEVMTSQARSEEHTSELQSRLHLVC